MQIINTIFPVTQGFDTVPVNAIPPFSPGGGTNNEHPVGVEANQVAPGVGVATSTPSPRRASSNPSPNPTFGNLPAPGVGVVDDSPSDDSDQDSPDGSVHSSATGTALGRVDAGTFMPNGAARNVVDDRVATQTFSSGLGIPVFVNGGAH